MAFVLFSYPVNVQRNHRIQKARLAGAIGSVRRRVPGNQAAQLQVYVGVSLSIIDLMSAAQSQSESPPGNDRNTQG